MSLKEFLDFDHRILLCPLSKEALSLRKLSDVYNKEIPLERSAINVSKEGFVNKSKTYFYPIVDGIILLLPVYALPLNDEIQIEKMPFNKDRVFRYYNEIEYQEKEDKSIYADSPQFVDFRDISAPYNSNAFKKAKKYISKEGKYFLDIASGPIGLNEYLALSENYDTRICIDISFKALRQAKKNLRDQKGIFICGDITNIPLRDNICDAVICQHTLYHVPRKEQSTAVDELYRVAKKGSSIAIVYNWFFWSLLMNITLFPLQIYRVAKYLASRIYVRLFPSKPRLYFYPHSPRWFKKLPIEGDVEIYCWRTLNKEFLNLYVHKQLGGKKFLKWMMKMEDKYPKLLGVLGDYPVIQINKK